MEDVNVKDISGEVVDGEKAASYGDGYEGYGNRKKNLSREGEIVEATTTNHNFFLTDLF